MCLLLKSGVSIGCAWGVYKLLFVAVILLIGGDFVGGEGHLYCLDAVPTDFCLFLSENEFISNTD
jgi:hypothetical protein